MTRSDHIKTKERVQACRFCRVSQRGGAKVSAAAAAADSDGNGGMLDE